MNYYIEGNPDKAEQIKAAFEKLGYDISWPGGCANPDVINIGVERNGAKYVVAETSEYIKGIIKTHPDYQELKLPIEPKFKVGDWLFHNTCGVKPILVMGYDKRKGYQVECIETKYELQRDLVEKEYHLWTIEDAKDGDVLATDNGWTCIFQAFDGCGFSSYCFMDSQRWFCEFGSEVHTPDSRINGKIHPATKEQSDLLFAKMREAGYEWDADKKELRKIQPHYGIANFKPFDKVLVRCGNDERWMIEFYCEYDTLVHTAPHRDYPFMGIGDSYSQCIPYEGNEHLLGTTDTPSEEYINW